MASGKRWAKRTLLCLVALVVIPCLLTHGLFSVGISRMVTNYSYARVYNLATACTVLLILVCLSSFLFSGGMMMFTDASFLFPTQSLFVQLQSNSSDAVSSDAFKLLQFVHFDIHIQVRPGLLCICRTVVQLTLYLALTIVCLALYLLLLVVCQPLMVVSYSLISIIVLAYALL